MLTWFQKYEIYLLAVYHEKSNDGRVHRKRDVRKRSVSNNIIIKFFRIITLQLINFFYSLYSGKYKCIGYVFCPRNQISFLFFSFFSLLFFFLFLFQQSEENNFLEKGIDPRHWWKFDEKREYGGAEVSGVTRGISSVCSSVHLTASRSYLEESELRVAGKLVSRHEKRIYMREAIPNPFSTVSHFARVN